MTMPGRVAGAASSSGVYKVEMETERLEVLSSLLTPSSSADLRTHVGHHQAPLRENFDGESRLAMAAALMAGGSVTGCTDDGSVYEELTTPPLGG